MLVSYQAVVDRRIHRKVLEHAPNGVLAEFDLPELAAAIAPRPIWIVNGVDPVGRRVDLGELQRQYAVSTSAFKMLGVENSIRIRTRSDLNRDGAFYQDWLAGK
jgi:hypothetical protein